MDKASLQHPDADQLSAFRENTLPEQERQKVLGHLGRCSDCRKIVARSLPPLKMPSAVEPEIVVRRRPSGWILAWIAAPILAALIILIVYLQRSTMRPGRNREPAQVAEAPVIQPKTNPSSSEPAAARTPPSASGTSPLAGATKARRPRQFTEAAHGNSSSSGHDLARLRSTAPARSDGGPSLATGATAGTDRGLDAALRQKAAIPASTPPQKTSPAIAPANQSASPDSAATSAQASHVALPPSTYALRKDPSLATQAHLPSGLPILSIAANLRQRLAIDTGNQLFLSDDAGQHWKAVSSPWRGRAIAVAVERSRTAPLASNPQPMAFAVPERFTPGEAAVAEPDEVSNSLSGTITDASGAALPRAVVALSDSRTASLRTAVADGKGRYRVFSFVPGLYRIDVQAAGFLKQSLLVDLTSSPAAVKNIVLTVGQSSETVSVEASTQPLQKEASNMSNSLSARLKQSPTSPPASQLAGPTIFVVTTDASDRWTSFDGQSWKLEIAP